MEKRGQFTILVVFALLAVIAIGIVLMVKSNVTEEQARVSADEAVDSFLQSNEVRNYVSSCLQAVSTEAIRLASIQGGAIWKHQNGTVSQDSVVKYIPVDFNGETHNVSYALDDIRQAECSVQDYYQPPEYPYPNATIEMLNNMSFLRDKCFTDDDTGFFGTRTAHKLCLAGGPNEYTCNEGIYARPANDPVQHQLNTYTEEKLRECTDFSQFEQAQGFTVEIMEDPEVEFTYGKEDVSVEATYPVRVNYQDGSSETISVDFFHRTDTRFKQLYEFFQSLVLEEATNSSFQPTQDYQELYTYNPGFEVSIKRNICGTPCAFNPAREHDDMLTVTDTQRMEGKKLNISGIIRNRAPVLNSTGKIFLVKDLEPYVKKAIARIFDAVVVNDSKVTMEVSAVDPDDDSISYSYTGLKSEGGQSCDVSGFLSDVKSDTATPDVADKRRRAKELFEECLPSDKRSDRRDALKNAIDSGGIPTTGEITFETEKDDEGVYTLRVAATDGAATDYQDIQVLVINSDDVESQGLDFDDECTGTGQECHCPPEHAEDEHDADEEYCEE